MASSASYWEDPYPEYERLRSLGPVHWNEDLGTWIITGLPEAKAALANADLSSRWLRAAAFGAQPVPVVEHVRDWLMWTDPPEHDVLREELSALFTARALKAYASDVKVWTTSAYDDFVRHGGGDVVQDFAMPLVTRVISKFAGLDGVHPTTLQAWSRAAGALMAKPHHRMTVADADRALQQLEEEITGHPAPERTVVGRARTLDGRVPGSSAAHLGSLFTFAGIETTAQALVRLVDRYADGAFTRDRAADQVVAELLRFDTPVPQVPRVAARRTEVCGHTVEAGHALLVVLAAANRDSRVFIAPATLTPRTDASRHLAYGHGRHRCLGASLASLILGCAVEPLRQHPQPHRLSPANWHRDRGYRGIARLMVSYDRQENR